MDLKRTLRRFLALSKPELILFSFALLHHSYLLTVSLTRARNDCSALGKPAGRLIFIVTLSERRGKSLLVLDDLYDSGETLKEVTRVLQCAGARSVKVLTVTRTIHAHP